MEELSEAILSCKGILGRLALFYLPAMIFHEDPSSWGLLQQGGGSMPLASLQIASWLLALQDNFGYYGKVHSQMFVALIYHPQIIARVCMRSSGHQSIKQTIFLAFFLQSVTHDAEHILMTWTSI